MKGDKTAYEWVVEEMDGEEIVDCSYFDEANKDQALAFAAGLHAYDFGLCKRFFENLGDAADIIRDEASRTYAYAGEDGKLPERFEDGSPVPKRFL